MTLGINVFFLIIRKMYFIIGQRHAKIFIRAQLFKANDVVS